MLVNLGRLAALALCLVPAVSLAEPVNLLKGVVHDNDPARTLLYKFAQTKSEKDGMRVYTTVYSETDGKKIAEERMFYRDGKFARYELDHGQINENFVVTVNEGKVLFDQFFVKNGQKKSGTEDWVENFVVGSQIMDHIQAHWAKLMKGEDVHIRFGIPDRHETFGFYFSKVDEEIEVDGVKLATVRMKPSSFFVAMFVKPLTVLAEKETGKIRRVIGRTFLKKKGEKGMVDLIGEMIME